MRKSWALTIVLCGGIFWLAGCQDPADKVNSSDPSQRIEAVRALSKRATDEDIDRVAKVAATDDAVVADEAVRGLGSIRRPKSVEALRKVAANDRRTEIREEAILQLGRVKDAGGLEMLRQTLRTDPDSRVRAAAATSLARVRSLPDVALLMEVADADEDLMVQSRCVGAVEQMIGMKFGYESHASPEERRKAMDRMRAVAMKAAANLIETDRFRNKQP